MSETNPTMNDLMRDLKLGTADEDDLVPRPDPESVPDFLRGYVKGLPEKIYPKEFESISKLAKMTIPDAVVQLGSEPVTLLESLRSTAISENHDGWALRRFVEGYANLIGNPDAHKKTLEDVKVSVTSANGLLGGTVLVSSMKKLDDTTAYLGVVKSASGVIVQHLSQNLVDYSPEKVEDAIGHFFRLLQMLMTAAARRAAAGNGDVPGGVNNNNKAPGAPGFATVPPSTTTSTGTGTQHTAARSSVPSFAARGHTAGDTTLPYDIKSLSQGDRILVKLFTEIGRFDDLQKILAGNADLDEVLRSQDDSEAGLTTVEWDQLRNHTKKWKVFPKNNGHLMGFSSKCHVKGRQEDLRVALFKYICRRPNVEYKFGGRTYFKTDEKGFPQEVDN